MIPDCCLLLGYALCVSLLYSVEYYTIIHIYTAMTSCPMISIKMPHNLTYTQPSSFFFPQNTQACANLTKTNGHGLTFTH